MSAVCRPFGSHCRVYIANTATFGMLTTRLYLTILFAYSKNRQKHENSDQHKKNVDRYLSNQRVARERQVSRQKEVERAIQKAERVSVTMCFEE